MNALRAAGERARGATMYVSLEPCTHHGSTPPCADAILEAGVERVVVGVRDPNPNVSGGGVERLREAGVDVEVVEGEPAWRARDLNAGWLSVHERGRPWVIYKAARHARRADDGAGRALGDGRGGATPRARAARRGSTRSPSGWARCARTRRASTRATSTRRSSRGGSRSGAARCPRAPSSSCGRGALDDELRALADEGVQTLLLEGGATLASAFLAAELVDKLLVFVAPALAGAGPALTRALPAPVPLKRLRAEPVGEDVLLEAYVHDP